MSVSDSSKSELEDTAELLQRLQAGIVAIEIETTHKRVGEVVDELRIVFAHLTRANTIDLSPNSETVRQLSVRAKRSGAFDCLPEALECVNSAIRGRLPQATVHMRIASGNASPAPTPMENDLKAIFELIGLQTEIEDTGGYVGRIPCRFISLNVSGWPHDKRN